MKIICGIDEVGRGPLAGPVVSAAVILPIGHGIIGLKDSKKISPKIREELFEQIIKISDVGIGVVSSRQIDKINILQATYKSMEKALYNLKRQPDRIMVDGFALPLKGIKSEGVIKGDEKIEQISAASIIAKVARDKFMKLVDSIFPEYEFKNNKGYGTKNHIAALKDNKATLIHRKYHNWIKFLKRITNTITTISHNDIKISKPPALQASWTGSTDINTAAKPPNAV